VEPLSTESLELLGIIWILWKIPGRRWLSLEAGKISEMVRIASLFLPGQRCKMITGTYRIEAICITMLRFAPGLVPPIHGLI
jgi:hypothetical protein